MKKGDSAMDNKKGGFFRFSLALSFAVGAMSYFFAAVYSPFAAGKIGFGLLVLLSLLCAAGAGMIDAVQTGTLRTSSKLLTFLFAFSVGAGSLAAEIFLIKQMETAAAVSAAGACLLSAVSAVILAARFREDDL